MSVNSCAPVRGISNEVKGYDVSAEIIDALLFALFIKSLEGVSVAGAEGEDTTELFASLDPSNSAIAQEA
jgi:hypothetical protein